MMYSLNSTPFNSILTVIKSFSFQRKSKLPRWGQTRHSDCDPRKPIWVICINNVVAMTTPTAQWINIFSSAGRLLGANSNPRTGGNMAPQKSNGFLTQFKTKLAYYTHTFYLLKCHVLHDTQLSVTASPISDDSRLFADKPIWRLPWLGITPLHQRDETMYRAFIQRPAFSHILFSPVRHASGACLPPRQSALREKINSILLRTPLNTKQSRCSTPPLQWKRPETLSHGWCLQGISMVFGWRMVFEESFSNGVEKTPLRYSPSASDSPKITP